MTRTTTTEKEIALKETLAAINKKQPNAVRSASSLPTTRRVPLDIPAYDYLTGGIIINQVTEHYGEQSSLKSYMFYKAIAKFQRYDWANDEPNAFTSIKFKKGKSASDMPEVLSFKLRDGYKPKHPPEVKIPVLIDVEGTYDPAWGAMLGVFNDGLIYCCPESVNQSIDILVAFLMSPMISLVVYDSMVAIGADAEVQSSMESEQMAINARLWNKASRKIRQAINANPDKDVTLCVVNSFYEKVGITFGNPEVVKNGMQMKLLKASSIRFTPLKELKGDVGGANVTIGRNVKLTNKKNKFGPAFREMTLYFSFVDDGELEPGDTDIAQQLIELGVRFEIIARVGSGYTYGNIKGRGMESFKKLLYANKALRKLKEEVYARF